MDNLDRDFTPLTDTYKQYTESIEEAVKDGKFDEYETAQEIIWPWDLFMAESEKEDVNELLLDVTNEIIRQAKEKGLTPKVVASYIFKTLITGMLWQRDRIGR